MASDRPAIQTDATDTPLGPRHPYDGESVRRKINDTRIPGLSIDIADQLAGRLWTFDGVPYRDWLIKGSCTRKTCEVSVVGDPSFNPPGTGDDLYTFTFDQSTGILSQSGESTLAGYPRSMDSEIEQTARAVAPAGALDEARYIGASWLPPPAFGTFVAQFRIGDLEAATDVFVRFELTSRRFIDLRRVPPASG